MCCIAVARAGASQRASVDMASRVKLTGCVAALVAALAVASDPPRWERVGTTQFLNNQVYDVW